MTASAPAHAQKGMGWFSVFDSPAHTFYITEITTVDVSSGWDSPNFAAGFVKAKGWEERSKREPGLRGTVKWITGMEPWRAGELQAREYAIEQARAKGYTIVVVPFPTPEKLNTRPAKASAQ